MELTTRERRKRAKRLAEVRPRRWGHKRTLEPREDEGPVIAWKQSLLGREKKERDSRSGAIKRYKANVLRRKPLTEAQLREFLAKPRKKPFEMDTAEFLKEFFEYAAKKGLTGDRYTIGLERAQEITWYSGTEQAKALARRHVREMLKLHQDWIDAELEYIAERKAQRGE